MQMNTLTPFPAFIQSVPYFLTDKVVEFIYSQINATFNHTGWAKVCSVCPSNDAVMV